LICLASAEVKPATYGHSPSIKGNKCHKRSHAPDLNPQPGALQHSAITSSPPGISQNKYQYMTKLKLAEQFKAKTLD